MLNSISIQRFKSIREVELSLARVNIFIGANGSGKSNFLEAIGLASACLSKGISGPELAQKGIRQSPPALIKSAHKGMGIPQTLEISVELSNEISYRCNLTARDGDDSLRFHSESCKWGNESQFGRSGNGDRAKGIALPRPAEKTRGLWDQIKASTDFDDSVLNEIDEFSNYKIYSPQTDYLRGVKSGLGHILPIGLHGEGLPSAVAEIINQYNGTSQPHGEQAGIDADLARKITRRTLDLAFLPGWTRSFRVGRIDSSLVPPGIEKTSSDILYFIDRYMTEKRNTLSAYDSSEGTLFLLFMAVVMCHIAAPKIFAVDNVDSALNPFLTRTLIEAIVKISKEVSESNSNVGLRQIFMTSHNPTSIDAFDIFDDTQRVFVVYRDKKGQSQCERLAPAAGMSRDDWARKSGGKTLSQMWVSNLIPNLNGMSDYNSSGVKI
jgi:AAA domain, putative AbiEii toxin, Type IV TA system